MLRPFKMGAIFSLINTARQTLHTALNTTFATYRSAFHLTPQFGKVIKRADGATKEQERAKTKAAVAKRTNLKKKHAAELKEADREVSKEKGRDGKILLKDIGADIEDLVVGLVKNAPLTILSGAGEAAYHFGEMADKLNLPELDGNTAGYILGGAALGDVVLKFVAAQSEDNDNDSSWKEVGRAASAGGKGLAWGTGKSLTLLGKGLALIPPAIGLGAKFVKNNPRTTAIATGTTYFDAFSHPTSGVLAALGIAGGLVYDAVAREKKNDG